MLKVGLTLYNRLEVHGGQHVPKEGGCVLAANHASYLDPPVISSAVSHRPVQYMARDTLFRTKLFGGLLRRSLVIPLSREKGDIAALRKSIELLKSGRCIGLFPEGTRTTDGELQEAKGGIGFVLAKAAVPVVPAYIDGTFRAYPRGAKGIRPAKLRVFIGEPISPAELAQMGSDREAYEKIGKLVMSRIANLKPIRK
jgi:1-acyl-sn-glycerol-3-phosphate acyltransferase